MIETANNESHDLSTPGNDPAVESRIFRVMALFVAAMVVGSLPLVPWRSTTGLALGGILSLFNYHWLRSSISALIMANATNQVVGHSAWRYVFRYAVIGSVVFAAYTLGIVSLPATIVGLCSFVAAFFAEALRQFYFAIIQREEIS